MTKLYHEYVLDDILKIIKDNLILLYNYHDDALINIRKFCSESTHKRYSHLDNSTVIFFTEEALAELINCDFLYDFRDIE